MRPGPKYIFLTLFGTIFLLLITGHRAFPRQYNVINYRMEQGFQASNGYCLYQDHNGYIWIGTENGLMRFNGRDFKLYTTRDGLPDNEVIHVEEDARGRLWVTPFTNAICYIQNGQVFNAANDPLLKQLDLKTMVERIFFDSNGTIWFFEGGRFTGIDAAGKIKRVGLRDYISGCIWLNARGKVLLWSCSGAGDNVYELSDTALTKVGHIPLEDKWFFAGTKEVLYEALSGTVYHYVMRGSHMDITQVSGIAPAASVSGIALGQFGRELFICSDTAGHLVDVYTGVIKEHFRVSNRIGAFITAKDSTVWIGTLGGGIFHFFNTPVKSVATSAARPSVVFIKGTDNGMYSITNRSFFLSAGKGRNGMMQEERCVSIDKKTPYCPHVYIGQNKRNDWVACAYGIRSMHVPGTAFVERKGEYITMKAVLEEDEQHLLTATNIGLYRWDKERLGLLDTFMYQKRIACLAKIDTVIYAGTLNGLYACYPDHRDVQLLKESPYLKSHIVALDAGMDGTLWAANSMAQLIGIKNGEIFAVTDFQKGRQCNRISCLKISGRFIWVGTDNGLFAIDRTSPFKIVRHLTAIAGLNSNQVNCLDIHKGRVWVGTAAGINYFEEAEIFHAREQPGIIINSIKNGEHFLAVSDIVQLEHKTLTIDFDVVDFSGGSRPVFGYRINDAGPWIALEGNQLYFPVLPDGRFTLTLRASSPNWPESAVYHLQFYNPPPYYHTWWFISFALLAGFVATGCMVYLILKKVRQRDRDKIALQQNLLRLEQMALQGQMNPHFIFNCITAIKQRYGSGNTEAADNFVDSFSSLIRQTFEMSTETFVSLDRELSYIGRYLEVEAARFNHSFRYHILRETYSDKIPVPAMLLQPVVENAIRHGIRHLPDGTGDISIHVREAEGQILFEIRDNGIGMEGSRKLQGAPYPGQPLTSSTVNSKRIQILNQMLSDKITLQTQNMPEGGTCITIAYPVNINQHNIS